MSKPVERSGILPPGHGLDSHQAIRNVNTGIWDADRLGYIDSSIRARIQRQRAVAEAAAPLNHLARLDRLSREKPKK